MLPDPTDRVTIIAEAGVNHNGELELAKAMVRAAALAGADFVKFQTFKAEESLSAETPKAAYQKLATGEDGSMLDMVKKLELPFDAFRTLAELCRKEGIGFLSTGFDTESIAFLADMPVPLFKAPSGELTNARLLLEIATHQKPVLLSTGMATLEEIGLALGVLAHGFLGRPAEDASEAAFRAAYDDTAGRKALKKNVTILHCTTEYPAPMKDINLRALQTIEDAFGLPIGYSDHSQGIAVPIAAVALGARVIEKHFTLDRAMDGPDHQASLEPGELTDMVAAIRDVEQALGSAEKNPSAAERANAALVRKSVVAQEPISVGEVFTSANISVKRPGTGLSAYHYFDVIGKKADRDYRTDEIIDLSAFAGEEE